MDALIDPQFWGQWIRIAILDICRAGDNALVIALAVRSLTPGQQFWGSIGGTAGAVGLRIGFIFAVSFLMQVAMLRLVGGLAPDMLLVVFWRLLSIPLAVWGSGVLAQLMQRFRFIIWLGGGVLGYVAAEMILHDGYTHRWLGPATARTLHYFLPLTTGVSLTLLGWLLARGADSAKGAVEKT